MADPADLELDPDQVATDVLARAGDEGAAKFEGWFAAPSDGRYRLYIDPQFREWLELGADDILHRIDGSLHIEGASVVWVKRDAIITRCQSACAFQFADEGDDSAGRRRPYP
ncbi:MAG: hypothetical protein ACRDLS_17085 [Solirubrobacteraceae bacterium]